MRPAAAVMVITLGFMLTVANALIFIVKNHTTLLLLVSGCCSRIESGCVMYVSNAKVVDFLLLQKILEMYGSLPIDNGTRTV